MTIFHLLNEINVINKITFIMIQVKNYFPNNRRKCDENEDYFSRISTVEWKNPTQFLIARYLMGLSLWFSTEKQ